MTRHLLSAVLLIALSLASRPADASDWMGKKVIPKSGTVALSGGSSANIFEISWPATVKSIDGRWLQIADENGGNATTAWVRSGDVWLFNQSLSHFNEQLRDRAPDPSLYWLRGKCWEAAGEDALAAKDYQAAVMQQPYNVDARLGLARTTAKSKYDDAKFVAAWQLGRAMPRLFVDWGDALQADKQPDRAKAMYNEAVRLNPNWRMPHYELARLASSRGYYQEALVGFDDAIRRDGSFHHAYRERAAAALASSKAEEAAAKAFASARRACELCYFREADSLAVLAQSLAAMQRWPDAVRYQEMAIEYAPLPKKRQHQDRYEEYIAKVEGPAVQVATDDMAKPPPGARPRGVDIESGTESSGGPPPSRKKKLFIDRSASSFE